MNNFKFLRTSIPGLVSIEPRVFSDPRGSFMEMYNTTDFNEGGISIPFVQTNIAFSTKGVLRGMHFQKVHPQGKLVMVIKGSIYDVVVDLRKGSPTYGKSSGFTLTGENKMILYVPRGMAHGYLSLTDETYLMYKCTDYYYPQDEDGLMWNDEIVEVDWPLKSLNMELKLASRDENWPVFNELDVPFEYEKLPQ